LEKISLAFADHLARKAHNRFMGSLASDRRDPAAADEKCKKIGDTPAFFAFFIKNTGFLKMRKSLSN